MKRGDALSGSWTRGRGLQQDMSDALFIGIDGGGTTCRARLCDAAGRRLGQGVGGPANARLDPVLVMRSIREASLEAAAEAGLGEGDLAGCHAGLGLAGAGVASARRAVLAQPSPFRSMVAETDAYAAWLGAHGGGDGAILIMGTGSCGLSVVEGRQTYVAGWGAEVSDEASGMWLGREAIRRSLWAHDGRAAPTPLADAVLARFDGSVETVIEFATQARPADFGRLVPLVLDHAAARDPLALEILALAAADAARIVCALLDTGAPSVCLLGGLSGSLGAWLPPPLAACLTTPRADALDGAVLMARRAVDGPQAGQGRSSRR